MNKLDIISLIKQMSSEEIVKEASPPPPPPSFPGGGKTAPVSYKGTGTSSTKYAGIPEVKEMQKAIQAFADKAVAYKTSEVIDPTTKKKVKIISKEDNRKDFNDFLTEQYSEGAGFKGEEYTTDPTATKKEDKQPTELVEMDNVIDGLRRIGPGGNEPMPDGRWDFRTNNAVNNVYAFAETLVRVTSDFGGIPPNAPWAFRSIDLKKMADNLIIGDPTKIGTDELKKKASVLTPLINRLMKFYDEYKKRVLEHPAYISYIKKDSPLFKVTPGGGDPGQLTPDQQQLMKQPGQVLKNISLPGKQGLVTIGNLNLEYINNMTNFLKLMTNVLQYSPEEVNNPVLQKKVLDAILQHVNGVLAMSTVTSKEG